MTHKHDQEAASFNETPELVCASQVLTGLRRIQTPNSEFIYKWVEIVLYTADFMSV